MRRKISTTVPAVILTIILVAILMSQIELRDILDTIERINLFYLFLGFVLYFFGYIFRSMRFYFLLNEKIGFRDLFNVVCVHNMMNNILPARTGEFSYVYLIKKYHNLPIGEGTASLLIARALDFLSISLLFFVSSIFVEEIPSFVLNSFLVIAILLIFVALILISLIYLGEKFVERIEEISLKSNLRKFRTIKFFLKLLKDIEESFNKIIRRKTLFYWCFLLSIFVWFFMYSMFFVLLRGMGFNLSIHVVVLGATFLMLLNLQPFQGIGKFGTYEGAWSIAFILLGFKKEAAIATGFGIHAIAILYFLTLGIYGSLFIRVRSA